MSKRSAIDLPELTPDDEHAEKFRKIPIWLTAPQLAKLDLEVAQRKLRGEDIDPETRQRINVNRGTIIRDLIDQHLPGLDVRGD